MKIIGKGTYRMEHFDGVPSLFKLEPFPFHRFAVEEIGDVNWQWHGCIPYEIPVYRLNVKWH
jgi:hypothetical protein